MPRPTLADAAPVILRPTREERLRVVRRRLGVLLAAYVCALQLAAALEATTFAWPLRARFEWAPSLATLALAALRGIPLGYFLAFAVRGRTVLKASLAAGAGLGTALELCALLGARPVTLAAIACVGIGGVVGALAFLLLARRLRARASNDALLLAPDLPLVGGAYVAAPLLWLTASAASAFDANGPRWGLILLTLYGASLVGSARASRGPAGGGTLAHGLAAALWSLVGLAPMVSSAPMAVAALAVSAGVFAALHPMLLGARGRERRVEGPALRRALPLLGLYLALAALAPMAAARAGQPGAWATWAVLAASLPAGGWCELAAAMTVTGYALTELQGRRIDEGLTPWRVAAPWVAAVAVAAAALRVCAEVPEPSLMLAARFAAGAFLCMAAARGGAGLYELQRRHARAHAIEAGVRGVSAKRARGTVAGSVA
ncbi:hypothetical protein J421_3140 [Gemmatirosa kalamazoonensis]|uniref:Uncharacterized protein n=1 Tax=Gemmatirosa kalamazoonensis TaxID=861299 RepID=W0RJT7_9BACT|nr:hypothetical protein [Gemmatirosa kalamazoonensis]AHG90677.1 hypothetical protein J421_3140 [Gemmatirosa kalamazoonensis]